MIRNTREEVSDDMLKRILGIDSDFLDEVRYYLAEYPDWDDEEIAFSIIEDEEM